MRAYLDDLSKKLSEAESVELLTAALSKAYEGIFSKTIFLVVSLGI